MKLESDSPIVSFIMPAFNMQDYIAEAIKSIINQTINNWELIIVDDGSTDKTSFIVKEFENTDSRIKYLKLTKNSGSAYQPRKYGIEIAKGKWIAPLDADDTIPITYLESLLNISDYYETDLIYPSLYWYPESNAKIILPQDSSLLNKPMKGKECIRLTLDGWKINCGGGIIKRELYLEAYDKFDSSISYSVADELLARQLLFLASTVFFTDVKYFYRLNKNSVSHKGSINLFGFLINDKALYHFIEKEYSKDSLEFKLIQIQIFNHLFHGLDALNKYKFTKKETQQIYEELKESKKMVDMTTIKELTNLHHRIMFKFGVKTLRKILYAINFIRKNN